MARLPRRSARCGRRCHQAWLGIVLFVVISFSAAVLPAFDIEPFLAKNQSPVVRIFGLPSGDGARLLPPGQKQVDFTLAHSSNFSEAENLREKIQLDGETTQLTLGGRFGLSRGLEWGVRIPFVIHGGGFLDGFLINYHDWIGVSQGGRDRAPRNRLLYRYSRDGEEKFKIDSAAAGPGDIELSAGLELYNDEHFYPLTVALRGNLKLPSGDSATLLGSGSTDAALWVAASSDHPLPIGRGTVYASAGAMMMSRGRILPEQQMGQAGFGSLGAGWKPLEWIAFKVQFNGHTPFYRDSDLMPLSAHAAQLLMGGTLALSERTTLDISVSEDIPVHTSPDVVLSLQLTTRF